MDATVLVEAPIAAMENVAAIHHVVPAITKVNKMGLEYNNNLEGLERLNVSNEAFSSIESLQDIKSPESVAEVVGLQEITDVQNIETESLSNLERFIDIEQHECLNDAVVTENIAEYLSSVENLKFENWKNLSIEQRTELLNTIEYQIAQIEHRPHLPIKVEKMASSMFGYQDSHNKLIALNSKFVMSDSREAYKEVIDTIIHEGRHAYQHYNVDQKCIHDSLSVVNTWRENFYDPEYKYYSGSSVVVIGPNKVGDVGYRLYYYQPVETDARNFASDVMLKLKNKGFF